MDTLTQAKRLYNSGDHVLRNIALENFSVSELESFECANITTFEEALEAYCTTPEVKEDIKGTIRSLEMYSKSAAALFKLKIITRVLNSGCNMSLIENKSKGTWIPRLIYSVRPRKSKLVGYILYKGVLLYVERIDSLAINGSRAGLGRFCASTGEGCIDPHIGLFGCYSEKVADHLSEHFGMLIVEAIYGDIPGATLIPISVPSFFAKEETKDE